MVTGVTQEIWGSGACMQDLNHKCLLSPVRRKPDKQAGSPGLCSHHCQNFKALYGYMHPLCD